MSDIAAHLGKKNEKIELLMIENERLRAAWELCEETAFMLLRTGGFRKEDRDRALTMLDRARAGRSPSDTPPEGSE